jgi:hypothetical protein
MICLMVNVMCVTKTRCQASICVGPIQDKTYENLHYYIVLVWVCMVLLKILLNLIRIIN